jgi:hypothetical protein
MVAFVVVNKKPAKLLRRYAAAMRAAKNRKKLYKPNAVSGANYIKYSIFVNKIFYGFYTQHPILETL